MKTFIQGAVSVALLLSGNLVYAATATADMPMSVKVPNSCVLTNVSAGVIIPTNGTEGSGNFTIICNITNYSLYVTTDSLESGNLSLSAPNKPRLPITGSQTYLYNGTNFSFPISSTYRDIYANGILPVGVPVTATIKFKLTTPTTALTPAAVYTDTFRVNVTY